MSSTDWKKPAIASRPLYSVGSPNVARYGSSKAPSSANISAAFFGSLKEKAVYSSMSSLAFFIDILLFLTISQSELLIEFPELSHAKAQPVPTPGAEPKLREPSCDTQPQKHPA